MIFRFLILFAAYKITYSLQCYAAAYPKPTEPPKKWDAAPCDGTQCFKLMRLNDEKTFTGVIFGCDLVAKCINSMNTSTKTSDGLSLTCCGHDLCNSTSMISTYYLYLMMLLIIRSLIYS